jgi:hypothetical protein
VIEIQAVDINTAKELGEATEAAFLARASGFGFHVSKPWGDSRRYDMVVEFARGFWRVQGKGTGPVAAQRTPWKQGPMASLTPKTTLIFLRPI